MTQFYSYLWIRKDGTPYYAGKGSKRRAFINQGHNTHCPKDTKRILVFPMQSESDAFESEIALIELFGRKDDGTGCLRNWTNGGEGVSGHRWKFRGQVQTEKQRQASLANAKKAADAIRGQSFSAEHRQRLSNANAGKQRTAEQRQRISEAKRGKPIDALKGDKNPRWGKLPANVNELRILNASRPRDARGRFFHDKP